MNRAQRRAARHTKRGRQQQAEHDARYCEHGHPKKTDGRGEPMCPHRCGFRPEDKVNRLHQQAIDYALSQPVCVHCRLIGGGHTPDCITNLGPTGRVFDAEWNELDRGPLKEVTQRLTERAAQ